MWCYLEVGDFSAMCLFYSNFGMGTIIHYAGETVIRYWYVKSSMRPELREGFTNRKIIYISIGIPQILLLIHLVDFLRLYITKGQFPTLLYQACLDPTSDYSIPFYTLLPFNVTMTYIYILTGAYNNLYLYRFLRYNYFDDLSFTIIRCVRPKIDGAYYFGL